MVLEECAARGTVVCSRLDVPPGYKAKYALLFLIIFIVIYPESVCVFEFEHIFFKLLLNKKK